MPGNFQKGHQKVGGRQKGTPNAATKNFKQLVMAAMDRAGGGDGTGTDGIVGYLTALAVEDPKTFATNLIRPLLPLQINEAREEDIVHRTEVEYRQALIDSGVPATLLPPAPRNPGEKPPEPEPGWKRAPDHGGWVREQASNENLESPSAEPRTKTDTER